MPTLLRTAVASQATAIVPPTPAAPEWLPTRSADDHKPAPDSASDSPAQRSGLPLTLCDERYATFATASGQILMAAHISRPGPGLSLSPAMSMGPL